MKLVMCAISCFFPPRFDDTREQRTCASTLPASQSQPQLGANNNLQHLPLQAHAPQLPAQTQPGTPARVPPGTEGSSPFFEDTPAAGSPASSLDWSHGPTGCRDVGTASETSSSRFAKAVQRQAAEHPRTLELEENPRVAGRELSPAPCSSSVEQKATVLGAPPPDSDTVKVGRVDSGRSSSSAGGGGSPNMDAEYDAAISRPASSGGGLVATAVAPQQQQQPSPRDLAASTSGAPSPSWNPNQRNPAFKVLRQRDGKLACSSIPPPLTPLASAADCSGDAPNLAASAALSRAAKAILRSTTQATSTQLSWRAFVMGPDSSASLVAVATGPLGEDGRAEAAAAAGDAAEAVVAAWPTPQPLPSLARDGDIQLGADSLGPSSVALTGIQPTPSRGRSRLEAVLGLPPLDQWSTVGLAGGPIGSSVTQNMTSNQRRCGETASTAALAAAAAGCGTGSVATDAQLSSDRSQNIGARVEVVSSPLALLDGIRGLREAQPYAPGAALLAGTWRGTRVFAKLTCGDSWDVDSSPFQDLVVASGLSHPNLQRCLVIRTAHVSTSNLTEINPPRLQRGWGNRAAGRLHRFLAGVTHAADAADLPEDAALTVMPADMEPSAASELLKPRRRALAALRLQAGMRVGVVVTECADLGNLADLACDPANSPFRVRPGWTSHHAQKALLRTAREIAEAMAHLHAAGVVHGGLTPRNVLLFDAPGDMRTFTARVTDVGAASRMLSRQHPRLRSFTGTFPSPELVSEQCCSSYAADVFAFGMVLFTLAAGHVPVQPDAEVGVTPALQEGLLLEWPVGPHGQLEPIFAHCVEASPNGRPSFEQGSLGGASALGESVGACAHPRHQRRGGLLRGWFRSCRGWSGWRTQP